MKMSEKERAGDRGMNHTVNRVTIDDLKKMHSEGKLRGTELLEWALYLAGWYCLSIMCNTILSVAPIYTCLHWYEINGRW